MMHNFLCNNHDELIARCTEKVAKRPARNASAAQLRNGIPMFLNQLTRTLEAEQGSGAEAGLKISGASGGDGTALSEIGVSAAAHGAILLKLGYTVDQVVHDYGDLCQAITDLAFERDAPFSVDEFRMLNRCLDNAIADAVAEFSFQRDAAISHQQSADLNERLGFLMHEVRNSLNSATLAVHAIEAGGLPMAGATGAVLKRSHAAMGKLVDRSLAEVRIKGVPPEQHKVFSLAAFITETKDAADLDAGMRGCPLTVTDVDPLLGVEGNRELLLAALANLLHNAFKFTQPHTEVTLNAYAVGDRILIDIKDNCGGLPPGNAEKMFTPFTQRGADKTGLGLGLSIARQSVTADGGVLSVANRPGTGCTFTISLPRCSLPESLPSPWSKPKLLLRSGKYGLARRSHALHTKNWTQTMLDHVFISVTDVNRSIAFYEAALAPLGIRHMHDYDGAEGPEGTQTSKASVVRGVYFSGYGRAKQMLIPRISAPFE